MDTLNGLIQKINSKKPRGTLKPNYSIPKIVAKRVISVGLICINYSSIIPADHSNYTVLLIYFSLFEDYVQKEKKEGKKKKTFLNCFINNSPSIRRIHQAALMVH